MLETERSSDEALREPTFRRLYLGALQIEDADRRLKASYIILLSGRMGLRTGEIQHVREEWIDWDRGEIAIPQHDPCACANCWIRAKQKASGDDEDIRDEIGELVKQRMPEDSERDVDEVVEEMLYGDEELPEEISTEGDEDTDDENRTAEEILYEERWKPKYERSARRVPFGHSRRLTAVIAEFVRKHEHLKISQVAMNNLVTEAAENAEGVDPENVKIRGLRATAATHYATFIRNPKALQDLMGWTRIKTSARYLRRAGAFTTDVVYHAFEKGDLKPAMFPGEPRQRYPILDNPLPYQNEPYDPMVYSKEKRQEIGQKLAKRSPRTLIHPRAKNPPESLDYDRSKHLLLTHEDFEEDIVRRGGLIEFETATLAGFYEPHERFTENVKSDKSYRRYDSVEEWEDQEHRQTELAEISGEDGEYRSQVRGFGSLFLKQYFRVVELVENRLSKMLGGNASEGKPTGSGPIAKGLWSILGVGVMISMTVIILIQMGVLSLQPLSFQFKPVLLLALAIAIFTAYSLPGIESVSEIFE